MKHLGRGRPLTRDIVDHADLRARCAALDLTLLEFSAVVGVSYSQAKAWGASYPVPRWVRLSLHLLRERGHARDLIDFHNPRL